MNPTLGSQRTGLTQEKLLPDKKKEVRQTFYVSGGA